MSGFSSHRPARAAGLDQGLALGLARDAFVHWLAQHLTPEDVPTALRVVVDFLWSAGSDGITTAAVSRYLAGLRASGHSDSTIRNYKSHVSGFIRFLTENGHWPEGRANPVLAIKLGRKKKPRHRWLREEEIPAALAAARKAGIWPEVVLALSTGMRLSELRRLKWSDVDIGMRQLVVWETKNGDPKTVPLCASALLALLEQRQISGRFAVVFPVRQTFPGGWRYLDRPRSRKTWGKLFAPIQAAVPRLLEGSGVGRAWHALRHTMGSRGATANINSTKLAEWMGHHDMRMIQTYQHLAPAYDADCERLSLPAEKEAETRGGETRSNNKRLSSGNGPLESWTPETD